MIFLLMRATRLGSSGPNSGPTGPALLLYSLLCSCLAGCNVAALYDQICEGDRCDVTGAATASSGGQESGSTTTGGPASSGSDADTSGSGDGGSAAASTTGGETAPATSTGDTSGGGGSSGGGVCGDGVVDPGEDCDDPGTACNAACVASRVVFVTSEPLMPAGAINGIVGADLQCQKRAEAIGLPRYDRYRSWLSTSKFDARDRVEHHTGRYILVTGEIVAEDFDELISGQLRHAIDTTEAGDVLVVPVWTGTNTYGYAVKGLGHCEDYTQSEQIEFDGILGDCSVADADWTQMAAGNPSPCGVGGALYCIEHP